MQHTTTRSPIRSAIAIVALITNLVSSAAPAGATVRTWNNPAGGSAGTASNWTPSAIPGVSDNLVLSPAGTYTVDFPASVPQVISHVYNNGFVTLTTSSPHVVSTSFSVGSLGTGTVALSGANLKVGGFYMGVSSGDYGHTTITSSGGLPATPSRFETTDTSLTQDALLAGDGKARLEVFGGSQMFVGKNLILGNTAASRCTVNVAGRSAFTFNSSMISLTNPRFGVLRCGLSGQSVMNITNGGFLHVAGEASLGGQNTGVGTINLSGTTFGASAIFDAPLYIGGNQFNGTPGGTGSMVVGNRGFVNVAGAIQVGDPDGGGTSGLTVLTGGLLIAANGLSIASNGNFTPGGGFTKVIGGTFTPKPNGTFAVGISGGASDAPEVWLSNGQANGYVSYFDGILIGGTAGPGTLRVTRPGTTFGTTAGAPCSIGAWPSVPGYLVVDSLATFEPSGAFGIGTTGPATATIAGGATVNASIATVGPSSTGDASLIVTGTGTLMKFKDRLWDGGTTSVPGANGNVLADSGATISGILGSSDSALVVVQSPQGHLTASNGATISATAVRALGTADVHHATYSTPLVDVAAGGQFGGHGLATGNVANSGVVHAIEALRTFGSLNVGGNYSQQPTGELRLALGYGTGPLNDSLVVTGTANFNGVLALQADPSYIHAAGDSFTVATYGSRVGTFSGLKWNGNFAGQLFDLVYQPHKLIAVVKDASVSVENGVPNTLRFAVRNNGTRPDLSLDLPSSANVRVDLYDVNGRRVAAVQDGELPAGRHTFALDGARRGLTSGVYFARATIGGVSKVQTVRVVLVH